MTHAHPRAVPESPEAWRRLAVCLVLATIGGVGMWAVVVALPSVQQDFGVARGNASLPYTMTMAGFGVGTVLLSRLADRRGILPPMVIGGVALSLGYVLAALSPHLVLYALAHAIIGFGSSVSFAPLLAHVSLWFDRRRGIANGIVASGNYLAGALWPVVLQHFIETVGWRATFWGVAAVIAATMLPIAFTLRRAPPVEDHAAARSVRTGPGTPEALGLSARALQRLLIVAGVSCCVAMAMPQVHIVAYCSDLGYGPARGAQMLSLMLMCGIVSRLAFGVISDRVGGLRTLLLAGILQCVALFMFLPVDGLVSLYVVSALFGLFQGGIVPVYAIIVREYFSPAQAGSRLGAVITSTLVGMALGGWLSGAIFDATGSYKAAFVNGILWNLVNVSITVWLLRQSTRRRMAHA